MSVLFANVTALTMDPARPVVENAFVAVEGTKIVSVGTVRPEGTFDRVVEGKGKVLMPGLVNCHTHVPMTLMRGYGGGHDLQHWLHDYIFPAEARLDDRAVAAGAALGLAEMIASGTTCIVDMYMHTGTIAQEILKAGISANLSCGGVYFGAPEDFSPDKCNDCRNQQELTEQWHGAGEGQILVDASIHAEYTSNPPLWQWMADYAAQHNLGMQMHISETQLEHESCLEKYGKTPIALLDQYGVWERGGTAAHCVWVTDEDMALMAQKHITAVHNPVSNLKLGSGVARVPQLLKAGVNVTLGTTACPPTTTATCLRRSSWPPSSTRGSSTTPWRSPPVRPWLWPPSTGQRPQAGTPASSPRERWRTSSWWTLPPPTSPPATTWRRTWSTRPGAPMWR